MMKFEEFSIGDTFQTDAFSITVAEIEEFAQRWDPLPQHLNGQTAKPTAPGLLVVAATWREWIRLDLLGQDGETGVGIDNIRFLMPITGGEELSLVAEVVEHRLTSKGRGLVKFRFLVSDSAGEPVLELAPVSYVRRAAVAKT